MVHEVRMREQPASDAHGEGDAGRGGVPASKVGQGRRHWRKRRQRGGRGGGRGEIDHPQVEWRVKLA